jgi:CSLREA domain-containing protein
LKLQPRLVIYTVLCLLALPAGAFAATFTVNTTADPPGVACPGQCSLRAAVREAGTNNDDHDTIILPAGRYQLSITGAGDDTGATGDLDASHVSTSDQLLTITGAGARTTTVVGTGDDRVLQTQSQLDTHISGVTFTGGTEGQGGGIFAGGPITLTDVAITGNEVTGGAPAGGGLYAQTDNTLTDVTISGNVAKSTDNTAQGGGMYAANGLSTLTNVTIANNFAGDDTSDSLIVGGEGGGLWTASSGLTTRLQNVTISGNTITGQASDGGGLLGSTNLSFVNSLFAYNTADGGAASNCAGRTGVTSGPAGTSLGHNLAATGDCNLTAAGDKPGVDPLLGPLQNNGGGTDTRALLPGSPAIDAGDNANCLGADQRGVARFNAFCDIGAFEFLPAADPPPPPASNDLPDPVLGKTVNVGVASGRVYYAVPPKSASIAARKKPKLKFKRLTKDRALPVNSYLDTRKGTVDLTSARPTKGKTQHGFFTRGVFQVRQSRKKKEKGITELRLYGGKSTKSCRPRRKAKKASAALSKKALRRLRSSARGRFRTRGRYGAATVRGTKWVTTDRCDGTLVQVTRGVVAVRDFRRKKTVLVKKGHRYLAKARVR